MDKNSLSHTRWECKYHLVFAPKYLRQINEAIEKTKNNLAKSVLPKPKEWERF